MASSKHAQSIENALILNTHLSNKAIAKICNTSDSYVHYIRQKLEFNGIIKASETRKGTDGKIYTKIKSKEPTKIIMTTTLKSEGDIQKCIIGYLNTITPAQNPDSEIGCGAGEIDIVTNTHLYEVKHILRRHVLFQALGQSLIYQQALQSLKNIAIVGGGYEQGVIQLIGHVTKIGVEVFVWDDTTLIPILEYDKKRELE